MVARGGANAKPRELNVPLSSKSRRDDRRARKCFVSNPRQQCPFKAIPTGFGPSPDGRFYHKVIPPGFASHE